MTPAPNGLLYWLADVCVNATVLLVVVLGLLPWIKQPVRRMTIAWGTLLGLAILAVLPMFPRRPQINLAAWAGVAEKKASSPIEENGIQLETGESDEAPEAAAFATDAARPPAIAFREIVFEDEIGETRPAGKLDASFEPADAEPQTIPEPEFTHLKPFVTEPDATSVVFSPAPDLILGSWQEVGTTIWFGGAILATCWIALGAWRTSRLCRRANAPPEWMWDELRRVVPISQSRPLLRISRQIDAALACGALRPAILLPEQNAGPADRRGIRAALAHEWAHIAHGDLWLLALERLLLPVYFAHPLFWLLRRRVRHDQELLADAAAAGDRPVDYAEALLAWAKSAPQPPRATTLAALSLWNTPCTLTRRIEMLLDTRHPISRSVSRLWRSVALTTVLSAALGLSFLALRPAPSVADGPTTDAPAERNAVTGAQPITTSDNVPAPVTSNSADAQAGDPSLPPNAASASADAAPAAGGAPAVANPAADKADANAARPNPPAATPPAPAAPLIRFDVVLISIDHSKLPSPNTLANIIRQSSGADDNVQVDGNVIVAKLTRKTGHALVVDLKKGGVGKVLAAPHLATFLMSAGVPGATAGGTDAGAPTVVCRHEDMMTRIKPVALLRSQDGSPRIELDVSVDYKLPPRDATATTPPALRLSSGRTIEASAELVLGGGTLVIAIEPGDGKANSTPNCANFIVVTPVQIDPQPGALERSPDATASTWAMQEELERSRKKYEYAQRLLAKGYVKEGEVDAARAAWEKAKMDAALKEAKMDIVYPPESKDVQRLRQLVKELQEEIRVLRGNGSAGKDSAPPNHSTVDFVDPEQELLRLDVKEAEVNYAAAKAEYDNAQQLANRNVLSQAELAARKLALDKAEIALQRIKVRFIATGRAKDVKDNDRGRSGKTPVSPAQPPAGSAEVTRALLELDVREAELDLTAARAAHDEAAQLHAKGVVGATELAARKLAVQKAEIALERAKVRLEASRRPGKDDNQSNLDRSIKPDVARQADPQNVPDDIQQKALDRLNLKLAPVASRALGGGRFRGGMKVIEVTRNGLADNAGIRVNDVLVGLGVWELVGFKDLAYVLDQWSPSDVTPLKFYLIRGNNVIHRQLATNPNLPDGTSALASASGNDLRKTIDTPWALRLIGAVGSPRPTPHQTATEELATILSNWEMATSKINRLECEFTRHVYDATSRVEARVEGTIAVENPQRAMYRIQPVNVQGAVSQRKGDDGKPFQLRTVEQERWVWNGSQVVGFNSDDANPRRVTDATSRPMPPPGTEFILAKPFLLGMPARELTESFFVTMARQNRENKFVQLSLVPLGSPSGTTFCRASVLLDRDTWLPSAIHLTDSTGQIMVVHLFRKVTVNSPPSPGTDFTEGTPLGDNLSLQGKGANPSGLELLGARTSTEER